ncbi:MAG: drug resistance transporter, EmrB/QacA subfamily [Firmicutes bacterium]|nr:drug resistance transporter, EmrB/QacA subfamily [Bacillota bacterium]
MRERLRQLGYYRWLIFGVAVMGTFMAVLDSSIVNVALPLIALNLGIELAVVQWVVSAYLLVITILLPLFGKFGDMYGRRIIFLLGFIIFTLGSLFCSISSSICFLVAARVVQAIGASMLMANSPAIVGITFPGKERGRALGMIGTVVALASMVGPSLGGLLAGIFSWQSIFYINLPIGLFACLLGYFILPVEEKHQQGSFDFVGAILFAIGMTGFLVVLINGQEWGWGSYIVNVIGIITFVLLSIFVYYESLIEHPMIDLSLFKCWPFLAGNLSGLLSFMAMFSNNMLLPFYLHSILLLSPTEIGLVITPFPLLMAVTAPVSGYLSERISPVILTCSGLTIMMVGLLYLSTLDAQAVIWQVAIGQAVMGLGTGMFQSPNNNSVLSSVPQNKVGLASGMSALMRNVGMVSGIAVAVSVFESKRQQELAGIVIPDQVVYISAFLSAYHTALIIGACFAGAGAIISLSRKGHAPLKT